MVCTGDRVDKRMFRCQYDVTGTKQGVGSRGEDRDGLVCTNSGSCIACQRELNISAL